MFTRMCATVLTIVLGGALGTLAAQGEAEEPPVVTQLDSLLSTCDDESRPGGFAVAVLSSGAVVFKKGYGYANTEHGAPFTTATPFDFASVAKQFTGLAVATLATRGELSLDDDIRRYLPEIHDFGTPITIRHLLHHTSGLRDWVALVKLSGRSEDDVIDRAFLRRLASNQRELNFPPGEEHLYSNLGYFLLAQIIEAVTGETFARWMRAHVFEPLEMRDTFILEEHDAIVPAKAYSYAVPDGGRARALRNGLVSPGSSSLISTVDDMIKWVRSFETGVVGGADALALMQTRGETNDGRSFDYGFGIGIYDYRGQRVYDHGGSWRGFLCQVTRFPEARFAYIFVANRSPAGCSVRDEVWELFLGNQLSAKNGTREPAAEDDQPGRVPEYRPSTERLVEYAGRYYSEELRTFYDWVIEGNEPILRHFQNGDVTLVPRSPESFTTNEWWISDVRIDRGESGRVVGLRVSADNGRVRGVRFRKLPGALPVALLR
jgi:CubicO group peptidase (beta-lactamase class C family)